jgi:ribitol 2-dehydrogenase
MLEKAGQLDILHANAGTYVGGDLVDADIGADRMLNLNVNVVMKNVHDVLPHMIERRAGDIIVTSSLAAHFPTPWEPVYASSKWAINCFVQKVRRQIFEHSIRLGSISPGPVISALLADWPPEKLKEAKESESLLHPSEVANVVTFMLTRPRGMTIRDVVMLPTNFDQSHSKGGRKRVRWEGLCCLAYALSAKGRANLNCDLRAVEMTVAIVPPPRVIGSQWTNMVT